jgi:hypothetical protein
MKSISERIECFPNIRGGTFSIGYTIPSTAMGVEIGFFPIDGIEISIRIIDGVARKRLGILEIKRRTKKSS